MLLQMLWDRADANGYALHMTRDPLPRTPSHTVLMQVAFGDHQVANITSDVKARTIGARLRLPALQPDGVDPHQDPRSSPIAQLQKTVFLATGAVVDVCDAQPCVIPHAP